MKLHKVALSPNKGSVIDSDRCMFMKMKF